MAKYTGKKQVSDETRREAMKLAKGTQSPGQTKAQTRLIAQGIERGIDLYKKQQKEKARARDRRERRQQVPSGGTMADREPADRAPVPVQRRQWLPWLLLGLTWAGIGAYWLVGPA